jgi:hypothetical protein
VSLNIDATTALRTPGQLAGLPGSLVERTTRCGTPSCHCHTDPAQRHGPYPSWTRRVNGKTVTRTLNTQQAERYRALFDNSRRLRALIEELEDLSVGVVTQAEGWNRTAKERTDVGDTPGNVSSTTVKRRGSYMKDTL